MARLKSFAVQFLIIAILIALTQSTFLPFQIITENSPQTIFLIHDLPGSKYTDSDLQKLITENIKNQRRYVQSQITYLENLLSNENKDKNLGDMEIFMERFDAVENDMKHLEIEYRTMQKEFKPNLKSMKLIKNVKEFIEYLKESKRVFHSKENLLESQLLGLKKPSAEDKSRFGNSFSGVWRFIACTH